MWVSIRLWPRLLRKAERGRGLLIFLSLVLIPLFCQIALSHRPIWQSNSDVAAGEPYFVPVIWPWAVHVWTFVMAPAVALYASTIAPDEPKYRLFGGVLGGFLGAFMALLAALLPSWWLWRLGVALQASDLFKGAFALMVAGGVSGGCSAKWPGLLPMFLGSLVGLLCAYKLM